MRRLPFLVGRCACALLLTCLSSVASAQTPAPQPGTPTTITSGFVTRTGVSIGLAHLTAGDPRFNWAARFNGDVDIADYKKGRINLYGEYDAVFGSERRPFDLNHENYTVDISATYRARGAEFFGVVHHVSRHLTDRQNDRAVAWNSVGVAGQRFFKAGENDVRLRFDLAQVFQHTYNDYTWTAWLTAEVARPFVRGSRLYGRGNGGFQGVDQSVVGRERLCGARLEAGLHLPGLNGGADIYLGYERRIDGYPLSRQRTRFVEWGVRVGRR